MNKASAKNAKPMDGEVPPQTDLQRLLKSEDAVDRFFAYLLEIVPEMAGDPRIGHVERAIRVDYGGLETYIQKRRGAGSTLDPAVERQVLALFNGRNATEVARRLGISRSTVYRVIKQPGGPK